MTREREHLIRTTQRKMMRSIVGTKRQVKDNDLEGWVDWVVRATRDAEDAMLKFDVPDWCEEVHRRRFRWAGHVARRHDGRWTREVLTWSLGGSRAQKRPHTRWTDSFNKFFANLFNLEVTYDNSFWLNLAEERDSWQAAESDYVKFVMGSAGFNAV
jgi:hypothetical protein